MGRARGIGAEGEDQAHGFLPEPPVLSSGCSSKGLWCLGIPSGNQQKPSKREVRRELSRRE